MKNTKITLWLGPIMFMLSVALTSSLWAAAGEPCWNDTPTECGVLNTLWRNGTAAGNSGDWYRNRDGDHAAIWRSNFPQISDYNPLPAQGFEKETVDAPRVVIGNASLGYNGLYSIVRKYAMSGGIGNSDNSVASLYNQYRANQTYWYPAVDMTTTTPTARDLNSAMFPYANQSIGKSGSELDEVTKYFHTLAAFKPAVKTKLIDEGLLIPTVQMIYRRTRVASDAEYLTGLAHPSAFGDNANDVAMINMAQSLDTNNIPPMIQMVVEDETYGGQELVKYNDFYRMENLFTSPSAIARIFRYLEYSKRMVINISTSFDANGLPLTYHFAVLRGDPAHVRITPLNAEGSRVEIEIDYHPEAVDPNTGRLSNLVVIGAFVHNGSYYSAPGFISSFSLHNESRTYGADHLLQEITYLDRGDVEFSDLSRNHTWDKDAYSHDFNQRLAGWVRHAGGSLTSYTPEGSVVTSTYSSGRPATATEVMYPFFGDIDPELQTNWNNLVTYVYTNLSTAADTPLSESPGVAGATIWADTKPEHGTVTFPTNTTFTYTPDSGFSGVDIFTIKEQDSATEEARIHKIRIAVGSTDTEDPSAPTGISVYGASSTEALISWPHTTDNVEVYGYHIYRDGSLIGTSYITTTFTDTTITPGVSYTYTVKAFDDTGNESAASAAVSGGSATLWGQDNFEDGNYTTADPTLTNGLTWMLDSGSTQLTTAPEQSGTWAKVGVNSTSVTKFMPPTSLPSPFVIEFDDAQQYATDSMGLLFLYQDDNNYYSLEITRDKFDLHRTMAGVKTTIGAAPALKMQHAICSAKFTVQVVVTGGAVVVDVTKSEWTTYNPTVVSSASQTVQWVDTNAAAAATFTSGRIGFYQDTLSNWNVAYYDNILISSLDGDGPDRDADGMADAWEVAYFGSTTASDGSADTDSDTFTDAGEYIAGTNPNDPLSLFEFSGMDFDAGSGLNLSWPSTSGRMYDLYYSTNLIQVAWLPLAGYTELPAVPPTNQVVIPPAEIVDRKFLQLRVRQ